MTPIWNSYNFLSPRCYINIISSLTYYITQNTHHSLCLLSTRSHKNVCTSSIDDHQHNIILEPSSFIINYYHRLPPHPTVLMTPPRHRPRRGAAASSASSDGTITKKNPPKKPPTKSSAAKKKSVPTSKKVNKKLAQPEPSITSSDVSASNAIVTAESTAVKDQHVGTKNNTTNTVVDNHNIMPLPTAGIIEHNNSTITSTDPSALSA